MNKLIGINHKIRDLGKIQMARRVTRRNNKSIGIKHWQPGGNSRTIYSTSLQLLHSCDVAEEEQADMSVLQKNKNSFFSRHVSKMMSQATDWRVTSWASCQWTASFLFVAWQETRLPYWLVRQAYRVHFCLASFKKIKQCTVVKPLRSAVVACLWGAIPPSVFQTALEMFLSLFPHLMPHDAQQILYPEFSNSHVILSHMCSWCSGYLPWGPREHFVETDQCWNQWELARTRRVLVLHPLKY